MANTKYKLVYTNWVNLPSGPIPIANGNHPTIYEWMENYTVERPEEVIPHGNYQRINSFDAVFQIPNSGNVFRHVNIFQTFVANYGIENVIRVDQIDPSSDEVYFLPYEAEGQNINYFYSRFEFITPNGTPRTYRFRDTLNDQVFEYIKSGRLKVVIGSQTEPSYGKDTLNAIEKAFDDMGLDPTNVNMLFGNCTTEYTGRIHQSTSHESLRQQAEIGNRYPIPQSSLGYYCDFPKIEELDKTKLRPKRFLCWNRTLNRPHRLATAYIALKHNLLEDSIFSFLQGEPTDIISELRELIDDPRNVVGDYALRIKEMLPYEVDTQTLNKQGKESFQTNENNKKEFYADTYLHITSETSFNKWGTPFMSEKTFRPILNLQPFIYLGNYKALEELHRLGFKTFNGYIDESYDLEPDPKKRFALIEKEILRFAKMSMQELHDWYYSLTDILIYNQKHFLTLDKFNSLQELFEKY